MGLTRRELIAGAGAVALGGPALVMGQEPKPKRALRVAFMTDTHVEPTGIAARGFERALKKLAEVDPQPDLLLFGGDQIMDAFSAGRARTAAQWRTFKAILRGGTNLPTQFCIGNHDIWGWDRSGSGTTGSERGFGKEWAMQELGLKSRFYSFTKNGWYFIVLDSTFKSSFGYVAKLDEYQFEWLEYVLANPPGGMPIAIVSHMPILGVAPFFYSSKVVAATWQFPAMWMHTDAVRLKNAIAKQPNVKVCISGHMHMVDRVNYLGVRYLCCGAVSGDWWRGKHQEHEPGFSVLDFFTDGSFTHEYVPWGWAQFAKTLR